MNKLIKFAIVMLSAAFVASCALPGGESTGSEYIPDMGHSIAYEANYYDYYSHNRWGTEDDYYQYAKPRKPVSGTIARGSVGQTDEPWIPKSGTVPYPYKDTEEDRAKAMQEMTKNPFPITEEGLARAKELYNVYCGICHGEKGDGEGYLVSEKNKKAKYPAQPALFTTDDFINASEGRYYHAIMYGKNVMGGYADKLTYEERWQVIHYIRSLQAKSKGLEYNEQRNTLNHSAIPGAEWHEGDNPEDMDKPSEKSQDDKMHNIH